MADRKDKNTRSRRDRNVRTADDRSPQGSEREADERRAGGPRYHGAGWQRADEEERHGGEPVSDAPRADDPVRVEPGQVPGTKGNRAKGAS
jgi:hypothetical protein